MTKNTYSFSTDDPKIAAAAFSLFGGGSPGQPIVVAASVATPPPPPPPPPGPPVTAVVPPPVPGAPTQADVIREMGVLVGKPGGAARAAAIVARFNEKQPGMAGPVTVVNPVQYFNLIAAFQEPF